MPSFKIRLSIATLLLSACAAVAIAQTPGATIQTPVPPSEGRPMSPEQKAILQASTAELMREMKLLGITALRTPVQATHPDQPRFTNYDEAKANPYPHLPDLLTMEDGTKVTTLAQWKKRRGEIKALFDSEVYGRMPRHTPKVTWKLLDTVHETVAGVPVITRKLDGVVDNSSYPAISVDILMNVTTPESAQGRKVPAIMMGGRIAPPPPGAPMPRPQQGPDYHELLLKRGWGIVTVDTGNVQADNGAGLDKGIIGLVNKGRPRSLDDWGVLRAWGWAFSRGLDHLQNDPDVNGRQVGVMGHSRGGKAALVTLVDDPRFAIGYISSSGAGGANLYRRNFGELLQNLAAPNEFHWMAGNFLKYAAVGKTADDLPVDSHEFIALVAPRPLFISGGTLIMEPGKIPGDAWVDAHGMFMAAAAASPAWAFYGEKGLGDLNFPPILTPDIDGTIGFRQHDQGHTPNPNWPTFIDFAARYLKP